jgi:hypothetical protein
MRTTTRDELAPATTPEVEPTLAELSTRFVRTTVPRRLYTVLQLALPFSIDFAMRGWWRPAAWALALAAFGAWGLADRWLWVEDRPEGWRVRSMRAARGVAGALAAVPPFILLLELFLRILGDAPGH